MKVSLPTFKALQSLVYDGEFDEGLIPIYQEFAEFCNTDFSNPEYIKLIGGLIDIDVDSN
jgi:hypothetical protein